jgi:outer membrane biosynthesis protein TonB
VDSEKKKQIKLGIIIVGLVGAATITLISSLSDSAADSQESNTLWKCTACLKTFDLTAREASRAQDIAGGVPILCPLCTKVRAYQVMACPKCGTLFFGSEVPNHNGQCPVCQRVAQEAKKQQQQAQAPGQVEAAQPDEEPPAEAPKTAAQEPQSQPATTQPVEKEKDGKKKEAKKKTPGKKKKKPTPKSL